MSQLMSQIPTWVIVGPSVLGVVALTVFIIVSIQRDVTKPPLEVPIDTVAKLMHLVRHHGDNTDTIEGYWELTKTDVLAHQPSRPRIEVIDHRRPYTGPIGRHACDNPARVTVHQGWMPPIGSSRISLMLDDTVVINRSVLHGVTT